MNAFSHPLAETPQQRGDRYLSQRMPSEACITRLMATGLTRDEAIAHQRARYLRTVQAERAGEFRGADARTTAFSRRCDPFSAEQVAVAGYGLELAPVVRLSATQVFA